MTDAPDDDKLLCYCKNVRYGEVRRSIAERGATSIQQVMIDCEAGTGCRTCHPEIEDLLEEHRAARRAEQGGWMGFVRRLFTRS